MNVAIIPARGGSKRIPRKNARLFHGKPIIAYSIEAAKASGLFDEIYVSTEDDEIKDVALKYGAAIVHRPVWLTQDDIGTQEVTGAALRYLYGVDPRIDLACCIYATVPLLDESDLRAGFEPFVTSRARYVYVNGWYYFGETKDFINAPEIDLSSIELDRWIGERWIDINTEDDWQRAERMYANLESVRAHQHQERDIRDGR